MATLIVAYWIYSRIHRHLWLKDGGPEGAEYPLTLSYRRLKRDRITDGKGLSIEAFYQPPLYPYLLAGFLKLFGEKVPVMPLVFQGRLGLSHPLVPMPTAAMASRSSHTPLRQNLRRGRTSPAPAAVLDISAAS